ncbi:hypothetical protein [Rhizobium leguminosarum]|uniref:hypothetical protein n=1 Tax=Rhizobium leguminosarum TaxID=384 RepID=UPI001F3C3875|nr:hypothetical protein [Rhizobium leguminosarum]UIJ83163.1 hypothetical protein LZK78_32310 [Rhizobium leguminosarum]
MIGRRQILTAIGTIPIFLLHKAMAQQDDESSSFADDAPPQLTGNADFAGVWVPIGDGGIVAAGPPPEIPKAYVDLYSEIVFSNANEPGNYFATALDTSFPTLVNNAGAGNPNADLKAFSDIAAENLCSKFWDIYMAPPDRVEWPTSLNLLEYITYIAVFLNETGGTFSRGAERYNSNNPALVHPGISYLFDKFQPEGKDWWKQSYNAPPNMTCGELFVSDHFNRMHAKKPLGPQLHMSNDAVWNGVAYPKGQYPTSGKQAEMGYILACDFFKFRGRGLIQTTWRSNYKRLVVYIQTYNGDSDLVLKFKSKWPADQFTSDEVCTISSDEDWNELFSDPQLEIPVAAVKLHAVDNGYLPLSNDHSVINSTAAGSIIAFGDRLGGRGYGARLRRRVFYICKALGTDLPT